MSSIISFLQNYGFFRYGKIIPGLTIHGKPAPYPVLNERAIRAGAGITLLLATLAFTQAFYLGNYVPLQIVVTLFFIDFFTKVILGTKFSPISNLANFVVANQKPEYVGAIQKRFAWAIGLMLSSTMIMLLFVLDIRGPINLSICTLCLTLMFLETSFGICVGCKIYNFLLARGVLSVPKYKPACPGNVCAIE